MKNVGKGNFSKSPAIGEMFIRCRATAPSAPPAPINNILVAVSIGVRRCQRALCSAAHPLKLLDNG